MFKKAALIFVLCFSISISSNATDLQSVATIELSRAIDVSDAKALNNAVDGLSNKVMECVKNKDAKPDECYCRYPQELAQLQVAYKKALKLHPTWQDQVLFWWRDGKHDYSYNLSLKGLRMQLEKKCPTHPSSGTLNGANCILPTTQPA
jgi:hypothetical protein